MRRRLLIILAGLLLVGVVILASRGQYDQFSGTWTPTDSFLATKLVTQMVVAKTQSGWEETTTYPDGKTDSTQLKRLSTNLLITLAPPAQGGFALWYYPKTNELGLVQGGGAGVICFEESNPPATPML